MIEVRSTSQLIGARLTLTAQVEHPGSIAADGIKQTLQLTTRRIARRLIRIDFPCQRFLLDVNVPVPDTLEGFSIELVRVSTGFARSRLQRSLRTRNGKLDLKGGIDSMYAQYLALSTIPCMDTMYSQWMNKDSFERLEDLRCESEFAYNLRPLPDSESLTKATGYRIQLLNDKESSALCPPLMEQWLVVRDKRATMHWRCLNHALHKIADSKGLTLLYADHDHIGPDEARIHPCFKPGWNPGLLRQGNYIGTVVLIEHSAYHSAGGLDASMGTSALYDLLLRLSHTLNNYKIAHINKVLFSLPAEEYQAPHGFSLGCKDRKALERFANAENLPTGVKKPSILNGPYPGTFQFRCQVPDHTPSVDIIIPTRDQSVLLERCVRSILQLTNYSRYTITVIDNDSEHADTLRFHKKCVTNVARYRLLHYPGAFNYSAINNYAVEASKSDIVVLLNNDTEITQSDWLSQLVAEASQPDVACVGAKLLYVNGLVQHAGVVAGMQGVAGHVNRYMGADEDGYAGMLKLSHDTSAVTAACLAIRRKVYKQLNGLDEQNLTVAFNDVDLCLRARELGYRNRYLAQVTLIHHESVSRGYDESKQEAMRFQQEVDYMLKRHKYWIDDDPAWNANFSRQYHVPVLVEPEAHQDGLKTAAHYAA